MKNSARTRRAPVSTTERALDEIYAEIPRIPSCTGACAVACGPIAATKLEWARVTRAHGRVPRINRSTLECPMLSPTGWCKVYSHRPFICRVWGATKELACPEGCEPERWLTIDEVRDIHERIIELTGGGIDGTMFEMPPSLWEGFALEARAERAAIIERVKEMRDR